MILDYLKERYGKEVFQGLTLEQAAKAYEKSVTILGKILFQTSKGFMVICLQGDAVILEDMYVKIEYRGTKEARRMLTALQKLGQRTGKSVIISFSEKAGKNQDLGLIALKAGDFVPAFETTDTKVFVRGI